MKLVLHREIVLCYGDDLLHQCANVVGSLLDACDVFCLVCHRLFVGEHNSWSMVARLRPLECFLYDPLLNIIRIVGLCWLNLTKWCTRVLFVGVSYRPDIIDCDDILSFEPS